MSQAVVPELAGSGLRIFLGRANMLATSCADNSKLIENAAPWSMSAMLFICAKGVGVLFQWPGWVTDSVAVSNYIIARQSLGQNSTNIGPYLQTNT